MELSMDRGSINDFTKKNRTPPNWSKWSKKFHKSIKIDKNKSRDP